MDVELKGVHLDLQDETKEFIDKKLEKLDFARDYIVSLDFTITKEKNEYVLEAKLRLRWGVSSVVKTNSFDLYEGLERLFDKLDNKVRKEKDKIKDRS